MDTDELVKNVVEEEKNKFKSINVEKLIDLKFDLGNLTVFDINEIDSKLAKKKDSVYLKDLARDDIQLLVHKLWQLPTERVDEFIIAKLPEPSTILPREKPIPVVKSLTKWEKFAKSKGIQKKKKGRMIWDEDLKKYIPRWGFKGKDVDKNKNWLIEVPENADPFEDQFAKKIHEKKERVAKNELQRLRNISRNSKGKVPGVGAMPTKFDAGKGDLNFRMKSARVSTASMGKFDEKIKNDKSESRGKKRKFESNFNSSKEEKEKNINILKKLTQSQPIIDFNKINNNNNNNDNNNNNKKNNEKLNKKKSSGKMNKGKEKGKGKTEKIQKPKFGDNKKKTPKKIRGTSKSSQNKKMRKK